MSQFVETPTKAFTAGAAIAQHLRVKLSGGKLAAADAEDIELGTLEAAAFADGDVRAVRLRTAQGTVKMVASEAISQGAVVYGADSGKVSDAANGNPIGIALEAATADSDVIEVLRCDLLARLRNQSTNTETLTGNKTLTAADARIQVLDPGGAGRTITLPAEAQAAGLDFIIHNSADAAEVLTIKDDGGGTVCTPAQNETAYVFCDGTSWRGIVGANN